MPALKENEPLDGYIEDEPIGPARLQYQASKEVFGDEENAQVWWSQKVHAYGVLRGETDVASTARSATGHFHGRPSRC